MKAEVSMECARSWRVERLMAEDKDFAYAFSSFEDVYDMAGRAVAMEWARTRQREESKGGLDIAQAASVDQQATAVSAKVIVKVDRGRRHLAQERRREARDVDYVKRMSHLRQPGRGGAEGRRGGPSQG